MRNDWKLSAWWYGNKSQGQAVLFSQRFMGRINLVVKLNGGHGMIALPSASQGGTL
jgi:hypothetical protein